MREISSKATESEMLHFLGSELDLEVDEVWERYDGPRLFAGHEVSGQKWLVAEIHHTPFGAKWLCAPQSPRALECVRGGRAEVGDALRHSASGTVVMVTLGTATLVPDRVLLCTELHDDLLPPTGWRVPSRRLEPSSSQSPSAPPLKQSPPRRPEPANALAEGGDLRPYGRRARSTKSGAGDGPGRRHA